MHNTLRNESRHKKSIDQALIIREQCMILCIISRFKLHDMIFATHMYMCSLSCYVLYNLYYYYCIIWTCSVLYSAKSCLHEYWYELILHDRTLLILAVSCWLEAWSITKFVFTLILRGILISSLNDIQISLRVFTRNEGSESWT